MERLQHLHKPVGFVLNKIHFEGDRTHAMGKLRAFSLGSIYIVDRDYNKATTPDYISLHCNNVVYTTSLYSWCLFSPHPIQCSQLLHPAK